MSNSVDSSVLQPQPDTERNPPLQLLLVGRGGDVIWPRLAAKLSCTTKWHTHFSSRWCMPHDPSLHDGLRTLQAGLASNLKIHIFAAVTDESFTFAVRQSTLFHHMSFVFWLALLSFSLFLLRAGQCCHATANQTFFLIFALLLSTVVTIHLA